MDKTDYKMKPSNDVRRKGPIAPRTYPVLRLHAHPHRTILWSSPFWLEQLRPKFSNTDGIYCRLSLIPCDFKVNLLHSQ
jgi:hypothetical protein